MKRILLPFLTFLIINIYSHGQSGKDIDLLIKDLSWITIDEAHSARTFWPAFGYPASDLLKIGKPASEKLFMSLTDPRKTAIIHIILTCIYEPENSYYYPHIPIYSCLYPLQNYKKSIGFHFLYNGLVWEWYDKYSIRKSQIDRIRTYWDKKLHDPDNEFTINPATLLTEIQREDSIMHFYSENKVYQNNSSKLDYIDLRCLFITNYPNPYFNKVFQILGNDSIVWNLNFKGDYYIFYITDGIEFYILNNKLEGVFLKPPYEGKLINQLKMSDNKEQVINKLGAPAKWQPGSMYEYDWFFEKYKMLVAFGFTNRIIDLQIRE